MTSAGGAAVVTGAGSGLGRSVAQLLLREGWAVVLAGRRHEALEDTAHGAPPTRAVVQPTDVTDPASVTELFRIAQRALGRVDLLVNNAGMFGAPQPIEDVGFSAWREVLATNLDGAFLCAQAAFRVMKQQDPHGGRIINNGSLSAHVPRPHAVAYTASKHAIIGLTRALALEGRPVNIACGQIDIGNAATQMTEAMTAGVLQADGSIAAEPTIDPMEVARAILYMASLPLDANVLSMTVMATGMPFVGRG
jgi:NAD(P)-dependent dehydrogenase (short-subunit alcohol dehydrogenase family)